MPNENSVLLGGGGGHEGTLAGLVPVGTTRIYSFGWLTVGLRLWLTFLFVHSMVRPLALRTREGSRF